MTPIILCNTGPSIYGSLKAMHECIRAKTCDFKWAIHCEVAEDLHHRVSEANRLKAILKNKLEV